MIPRLALLLLALGFVASVAAQPQQWAIERLTMNDGLPENVITALTQDHQGFLWAATRQSGLVRYDGYSFVSYRHDAEDPASLAHDSLTAVYTDRAGTLWVGTFDGLDRLDRATDTFVHYRHDPDEATSLSSVRVTALLEDQQGRFWVGTTAGLNRMDRATGTFASYRHDPDDPNSLAHDHVNALYQDRDGILWVGTEGGLHRLNAGRGDAGGSLSFTRYRHDPDDPTSLRHNRMGVMYEDTRGNFWVGTVGSILHRMDRAAGRFTRYPDPGGLFGLITAIEEDASGGLWITASVAGANRFRFENDSLIVDDTPGFLYLQGTQTVYSSRDGTLWFGTNAGLFRVDPAPQPITFQPIKAPTVQRPVVVSLIKDRDGHFWAGTEAGVFHDDPTTGESTWYRHDPENPTSLSGNEIFSIFQDRTGDLWFATVKAFHRLNRATNRITRIIDGFAFSGGIEDEKGSIWTGDLNGAYKIDPASGAITSLGHNWTQYIVKGRDGAPWFGLLNGFSHYNQESDTFTSYFSRDDSTSTVTSVDVHAFIEDHQGRLWYGSPHGQPGLNRVDPKTGHFEHIPSPASTVYSFLDDELGNLWMATDAGLLMYDLANEDFTSYADHPVLRDWDVGGYHMGAYKDEGGTLHFGAVGGIYSFNPQQLRSLAASPPPQVALTALHVGLDAVVHGEDAPIQQPIWEAEDLTLAHTQNTFSLTFAGLHYKNPEGNRHQYMLENYDETWREAGPDRRAEYIKVPPGAYVFRARAANSDGIWSEEEATVRVRILPPWWQTTWAYGFYGLIFVAGVFAVDRFQRRRLIRKERERARERELEQAREIEKAHAELQQAHRHLKATQGQLIQSEKMASLGALTAGIAHEIKNPLNFVNNFAEVNEELIDEVEEDLAENPDLRVADIAETLAMMKLNAAKIHEQGRRADGIVKAMMEHARGGEGQREPTDVNAMVEEYFNLAYHGMRAQMLDFNVTMERDYDEAAGEVEMVPQEMGRVLINLLNNAFYAVHERATRVDGAYVPTVRVATRHVGGQVEIRVSDNGPGIPSEINAKIFEPFFTTKPTGSGTGLGLSLSYDIVTQGHGGMLSVESKEGEGATFVVTLPL